MAKLISQPFPYHINAIPEPAPFSNELQSFHRNDCLVVDNGWVGYLQSVDTADGTASSTRCNYLLRKKQEPKRIYRYVMFTNSLPKTQHQTEHKKKGKT
jgi:hypothetical protein